MMRTATSHNDCAVLFTKPAVPGQVKTRLIGPRLSALQAAALHAAFVRDTSAALSRGAFDLKVAWALAEGQEPDLHLVPKDLPSLVQEGRDLGERLFSALDQVSRNGYKGVAAVGSDHPGLPPERLEEAFLRLRGFDVVVGPVADGGYDLIAVRAESLSKRLFEDISWSTEFVLKQTLERAADLGLTTFRLDAGFDVDTPGDLERLVSRLADDAVRAACPATVHQLDELDLLAKGAKAART